MPSLVVWVRDSGKEKDKISMMMRRDEIDIIFATSVFKVGVDIDVLDTLYSAFPMSGKNHLQLMQMLGRIRRVMEDKKHPMYRYFADTGGMLTGCGRSIKAALVTENLGPVVRVTATQKPKDVMSMPLSQSVNASSVKATTGPKKKGAFSSIKKKVVSFWDDE
jgi:hypothetical protein